MKLVVRSQCAQRLQGDHRSAVRRIPILIGSDHALHEGSEITITTETQSAETTAAASDGAPLTPRAPGGLGISRATALLVLCGTLALAGCSEEEDAGVSDQGAPPSAQEETAPAQAEVPISTGQPFNARKIYAQASPGVVTVRSVFEGLDGLGGGGQGSGFVISDSGEIVTNAHVVTDAQEVGAGDISQADQVFVEFTDRNQVPAKVIGFDPNADIALLEVDPDGLDLEPLELGNSDSVQVGTPVAAIGSPFGQEQSLSIGIVSATNRSIQSLTDFRIDGGIQTDASINPGNSGGPLIDPTGRVIGVNQQINTTSGGNEGVGFAVPANLVQRSIDDLRDDGEAVYAFIGVSSVPLYPQLADKLDIDAPTGSLIIDVTKGGPAATAGLRGAGDEQIQFQGQQIEVGGDVIVAIDGEELRSESDLARLISAALPGDTVAVEIIRDGRRQTVDVVLEARPDSIS